MNTKNKLTAFTFLLLVIAACDNPTRVKEDKAIPQALEDDKSFNISKRGYDDMIQNLYAELSEKTSELNRLEVDIKNLEQGQIDSSKSFNQYNEKSLQYYYSANRHYEQIKDSVIRKKMKDLILNSQKNYNLKSSASTNLLKSIDAKLITLEDLHNVLKITRTLPLIEKYQREKLPSAKPLKGFSTQLDKTLKYTDSIIHK